MPNPRLASRYAKSLIDLAIEKGLLEDVLKDMQWLQAVCKSNRDFVTLLRSPIIKGDIKKKIVDKITEGRVSELTSAFIRLLISKSRESNLPEIISAFIEAYKSYKKIHTVKLTTAAPIGDSLKQTIVDQVKKAGNFENIELVEDSDPGIIGGFVLQVGDRLVDASVAYDLKAISRQFENNDFIYNIR